MAGDRTAAFLIIGNEILSGRTADVNLNRLAKRLSESGVSLREARVVRDETGCIVDAVRALSKAYGYVFTSGGIGPTHDDITTAAIAQAFGAKVTVDPEARAMLEAYYAPRSMELTPARLKMATIPEGAELIRNRISGAPAYRLDNIYVLAGVPSIFAAMLDEAIAQIGETEGYCSRTVRVFAGESTIASLLESVQDSHPGLDVGSYPKMSAAGFSCDLVVTGLDAEEVSAALEELLAALSGQDAEYEEITRPTDGS